MLEESVSNPAAPTTATGVLELNKNQYACSMLALDRLPVPYPVLVVVIGVLAAVEQLLEYLAAPPGYRYPTAVESLKQGAVVVYIIVYVLTYLGLLKNQAVDGLARLRPSVKIGDQEYEGYARRMLNADRRVELLLFVISVAVVCWLFFVRGTALQNWTQPGLPTSALLTVFFISIYVLLGWLLLALFYSSVRFARGLGGLARQPLVINVYDPGNLLPFGELGLMHSLVAVGLFLIPILLIGMPRSGGGYIVLALSAFSLAALFVPLFGVHRQIDDAKDAALDDIYARLMETHTAALATPPVQGPALADLTNRAALLNNLRQIVMKAPGWPFRDVASLVRAVVAVASPFIIFILQALISTYFISRLPR
jgi:hypothetical protein